MNRGARLFKRIRVTKWLTAIWNHLIHQHQRITLNLNINIWIRNQRDITHKLEICSEGSLVRCNQVVVHWCNPKLLISKTPLTSPTSACKWNKAISKTNVFLHKRKRSALWRPITEIIERLTVTSLLEEITNTQRLLIKISMISTYLTMMFITEDT